MMLQKLLVATDFSLRSSYALQRAVQLSRAINCQLSALHVIDPKSVPWEGLQPTLKDVNKALKLPARQ